MLINKPCQQLIVFSTFSLFRLLYLPVIYTNAFSHVQRRVTSSQHYHLPVGTALFQDSLSHLLSTTISYHNDACSLDFSVFFNHPMFVRTRISDSLPSKHQTFYAYESCNIFQIVELFYAFSPLLTINHLHHHHPTPNMTHKTQFVT